MPMTQGTHDESPVDAVSSKYCGMQWHPFALSTPTFSAVDEKISSSEHFLHTVSKLVPSLYSSAETAMCSTHGATAIACLGVDFMAESVAAILAKSGYGHVPVYRATPQRIGCSLADAAERGSYYKWLSDGVATTRNPLHVVYINTSLETKSRAASIMPTITCTSSNVVKTILQADAQLGGDVTVHFGPDTCMGDNLRELLLTVSSTWSDADVAEKLHRQHSRRSVRSLADRLRVYPLGSCVVHHMFGREVVETVQSEYSDAYVTAHLEVPGEMFKLAMAASLEGRGVVGSTKDILNFIVAETTRAAKAPPSESSGPPRLRFVLGTEGWRAEWVQIRKLAAPTDEIGLALERAFPDVEVIYGNR